jgi:chromosomal replication initiation ATPase DnaA
MDKVIKNILNVCVEEFEVDINDITDTKRYEEIVYCRKAFAYITYYKLNLSYRRISECINRSTSTVLHYIMNQPTTKYYTKVFQRIKDRLIDI